MGDCQISEKYGQQDRDTELTDIFLLLIFFLEIVL
jgi:hypothetical protein